MMPALISATVAFAIFVFSQRIVHRREQTKLLVQKLEELYLLLLEFGEFNSNRFKRYISETDADGLILTPAEQPLDRAEWFGVTLVEKLKLYVDFYFPQLNHDLERLFEANREMTSILVHLGSGNLTYQEIQKASISVGNILGDMEARILSDRPKLTEEWGSVRALLQNNPREDEK